MVAMAAAGNGTNYLVEFLPILKYLPSWCGAKFESDAKGWRKVVLAISEAPFELLKVSLFFFELFKFFINATIRRTRQLPHQLHPNYYQP